MSQPERPSIVRPGEFGLVVAADARRSIFDLQNESLAASGVPVDAVFIGDSITDGWALDAFFRGTEGVLVNRGIGGDQTPYLRRRFAADVVQLQPRLVVILIGINNMWALDTWWDARLHRTPEEILAEIVTDTRSVVEEARQHRMAIALGSLLPTNIPYNANTRIRNQLIVEVNAHLPTLLTEPNEVFVNYHPHFVDADGMTLAPGWADDGLHPHVRGYREMARILLADLAQSGLAMIVPRMESSPSAAQNP